MATERISIHGQWSSRLAFILAATGSAVGLGNIWKFPYIAGESGGGAFVLIYVLCVAAIGVPIMMAEVLIGRRGRQSPINTMRTLAEEEGRRPAWQYLGWGGVVAGFLILSYYSVIAGWALAYVFRSGSGVFTGVTADGATSIFVDFINDPERLLAWHTIFMVMTTVVVARGVQSGLEQAVRFLMPALFALLLVLVGYAMSTDHFMAGIHFLFDADFSRVTPDVVLTAMGQAFFTLSLGMGAIMVYGSYLPKDASIARTSMIIATMDTLVALLAGLAIFPIVFANGLPPSSGPGLIFTTLPIAFGNMAGGQFFGTLFFVLLVFAAWSSAISLIEPAVAYLVENRGMNRVMAAAATGIASWLLGILTVLSFNHWAFRFEFGGQVKENGIFDILDILTANIMLPLGGVAIAIFAAWAMTKESTMDELAVGKGTAYWIWRVLVRFVAPVAVLLVFLNLLGLR